MWVNRKEESWIANMTLWLFKYTLKNPQINNTKPQNTGYNPLIDFTAHQRLQLSVKNICLIEDTEEMITIPTKCGKSRTEDAISTV